MNGVGAYAAVSTFTSDGARNRLTSSASSPRFNSNVIIILRVLKSHPMQGSTSSATLSSNAKYSVNKALDYSNSTLFDLKPHMGVAAVSGCSSDDGYDCGQKVVKGSKFPRINYKCKHGKCEVKKIFERSYTGQMTEIVCKGTHDHPIPHPNRGFTAGALMSIQEEDEDNVLSGEAGLYASGQVHNFGTYETSLPFSKQVIIDNMDGSVPQLVISRSELSIFDITPVVKPINGPRVVVQTISEVDIMDDGYRWRKYGQKVVRGNPNPRRYYKCTSVGCIVRKHVQRASHDPKAVITSYVGKHNHDLPPPKNNSHNTLTLKGIQ